MKNFKTFALLALLLGFAHTIKAQAIAWKIEYVPQTEKSGFVYLTGTMPADWQLVPGSLAFENGKYNHAASLGSLEPTEASAAVTIETPASKLPALPPADGWQPSQLIYYRIPVSHSGQDYRIDGMLRYTLERENYAPVERTLPIRMSMEAY
jgi:hypothetical protein